MEPRYNEVLGTIKITLLYQVSHYIRVKKQRNIKSWDQQNYLVIRGFCYIRPLYNKVPLYLLQDSSSHATFQAFWTAFLPGSSKDIESTKKLFAALLPLSDISELSILTPNVGYYEWRHIYPPAHARASASRSLPNSDYGSRGKFPWILVIVKTATCVQFPRYSWST